jgi:hypothetical protein
VVASSSACCSGLGALVGLSLISGLRSNLLEEQCVWVHHQAPVAACSARVVGASPSLRLRFNRLKAKDLVAILDAPVAAGSIRVGLSLVSRLRSNPLEERCVWLRHQAPVAAGSARKSASPFLPLRSNPLEGRCVWLHRQAPVAAGSIRAGLSLVRLVPCRHLDCL